MGQSNDYPEEGIDVVRETRMYAEADGDWVPFRANPEGEIEVSLDGETVGLLDSNDNRIDPATTSVYQSAAGNDEIRSRIFGPDDDGNLHQVEAEQLGSAVDAASSIGLVTYPTRALSSVDQDAVLIAARDALSVASRISDRDANTINLQVPGSPISGGNAISAVLADNDSFTLYLSSASAVDVTVELSPSGTGRFYEVDESPVSLLSAGDEDVTRLTYDAQAIRLEGDKNTNVRAQLREVI